MKIGLGLSLTSMRRRRDTPAFDPDALAYITAVETADGEALEAGVKAAINDFVVGCKDDGIWDALKASCILAGARTLNGCLVPLVGSAPTNFNFVSADYNRKTGLIGDGSTKSLNSNRNNNADPQNNQHMAVFATALIFENRPFLSSATAFGQSGSSEILDARSGTEMLVRHRSASSVSSESAMAENTLSGVSRADGSSVNVLTVGTTVSRSLDSQTPQDGDIHVFSRRGGGVPTASRLAFYSIGESIDLAALDARVSALMTAISEALT